MSRALFSDVNFRWYLASVFLLTLGLGIQIVAVGWQVYALTNDPLALGLIGLAEAIPSIGIALWGGHLADRFNRRRLVGLSTLSLLVAALALFFLSFVGGSHGLLIAIYGVIVTTGLARGILAPARSAMGTELVPAELVGPSVNIRTGVWQTGAVVGPALGGFLWAWGGPKLAYGIDALLIAASLGCLAIVRYQPKAERKVAEPFWWSVTRGLAFLRTEPVILGAIFLDLFAVLFGGAVALLPVFARDILHVGEQGLGVLRAAPAVGAVAMSLLIMRLPPMRRSGAVMLWSVVGFGLCTIGFGLSRSFELSLLFLLLIGTLDYVSVCVRHTLIQTRTPTELLGRVAAVNTMFIGSSNEIGAFESGVTARLFGTTNAVVLGGVLAIAVVAVVAWRCPGLRRLDRLSASPR